MRRNAILSCSTAVEPIIKTLDDLDIFLPMRKFETKRGAFPCQSVETPAVLIRQEDVSKKVRKTNSTVQALDNLSKFVHLEEAKALACLFLHSVSYNRNEDEAAAKPVLLIRVNYTLIC